MKKFLIIILAFGLTMTACQKSDFIQANDAIARAATASSPASPNAPCVFYRIFNQRGPMGTPVIFEYTDCDGIDHTEYLDPYQMILVTARPGTVRCSGGIVTPGE